MSTFPDVASRNAGRRDRVQKAIRREATEATLTRQPPLPATPWDAPSGSPQQWTVRVVVIGPKREWIGGTLVQTAEQQVLMDATGPRPEPEDQITIGADTFRVLRVHAVEPAGVPLLYTLEVQR